jgi:benzodiazapine receptor
MSLSRRPGPLSEPASLPRRRPLASAVGAVLVCVLLGAAGGLLTAPAIEGWYATLTKPSFNPPNWVFGPVWTVLYTLQGLAVWLLWRRDTERRAVRIAIALFCIQFVLNLAWSPAFFGLQSPALGLVVIVPLWAAIVATIEAAWRVDRRASLLLVPYALWVTFAAILNYAIWMLN